MKAGAVAELFFPNVSCNVMPILQIVQSLRYPKLVQSCRNEVAPRFAAREQPPSRQPQATRLSAPPPRQHRRMTRPCLQGRLRNPPGDGYNGQTADKDGQQDDELGEAMYGLFSINSRSFVYGTAPMMSDILSSAERYGEPAARSDVRCRRWFGSSLL